MDDGSAGEAGRPVGPRPVNRRMAGTEIRVATAGSSPAKKEIHSPGIDGENRMGDDRWTKRVHQVIPVYRAEKSN